MARPRILSEHSATGYRYGCRCEVCTKARVDYQRRYKRVVNKRDQLSSAECRRAVRMMALIARIEYLKRGVA